MTAEMRLACVLIASLSSAALAADAGAAMLKISVPSRVRNGRHYTIALSGSFRTREVSGRAYLISVIQYGPRACKPSAQLENLSAGTMFQWYFKPRLGSNQVGIYERRSPFSRRDTFTARSLGSRHVCAYLYPRLIGPSSATAPIARADRAFKVLRR
jgi:hypothetical protein